MSDEELNVVFSMDSEGLAELGVKGIHVAQDFVNFLKNDEIPDKNLVLRKLAHHTCQAALVATKFILVAGPAFAIIGTEIVSLLFHENRKDDVTLMKQHMKREFGAIHDKLDKMTAQIAAGFDDVKKFISDLSMEDNIIVEVDAMERAMRVCIAVHNEDAKDEFLKACKWSPLVLMSKLATKHKPSENPLTLIMKTDKFKCRFTYLKWEKMVKSLMSRLNTLYYFYVGIKQFEKEHIVNEEKEIRDIKKILSIVADSYRINWKETAKTILDEKLPTTVLEEGPHPELIYDELSLMHSKVRFTVFVYIDTVEFEASLPHHHPNVIFIKYGEHNVFIYAAFDQQLTPTRTVKELKRQQSYADSFHEQYQKALKALPEDYCRSISSYYMFNYLQEAKRDIAKLTVMPVGIVIVTARFILEKRDRYCTFAKAVSTELGSQGACTYRMDHSGEIYTKAIFIGFP